MCPWYHVYSRSVRVPSTYYTGTSVVRDSSSSSSLAAARAHATRNSFQRAVVPRTDISYVKVTTHTDSTEQHTSAEHSSLKAVYNTTLSCNIRRVSRIMRRPNGLYISVQKGCLPGTEVSCCYDYWCCPAAVSYHIVSYVRAP